MEALERLGTVLSGACPVALSDTVTVGAGFGPLQLAQPQDIDQFRAALPPVEHEGQPRFDARSLHAWLGSKTPLHKWIERRIADYGFEAEQDFWTVLSKIKPGPGRRRTDYLLSRDMAKELAMVENNEIGRRTRRYFILMEKAAVEMAAAEFFGKSRKSLGSVIPYGRKNSGARQRTFTEFSVKVPPHQTSPSTTSRAIRSAM